MRHFSVRNTPYVLFEPEEEELVRIAAEAGFQAQVSRKQRALIIRLTPREPRSMFFDAADNRHCSRLAIARTFASGATGVVFNTPFVLESASESRISVRLSTELRWDVARRFPQGPTETSVLALFQQLVEDLAAGMVGLCGAAPPGQIAAGSAP